MWKIIVLVVLVLNYINAAAVTGHNFDDKSGNRQKIYENPKEKTAEYWNDIAQDIIKKAKAKKPIENVAKNVILFLGDGMSVATITAARIYAGGVSNELSFEKFPYTAISKTYCADKMVSESTSTATAYLGGVKANFYTSGVTAAVKYLDCEGSLLPENQVQSIASWSQKEGKSTGYVTTTRVTHASPAAVFSHTSSKDWESDTDVITDNFDPEKCPDIAKQLIYSDVGKNLNVIMGCGRNKFLPKTTKDEEEQLGDRSDGKDLINDWKNIKLKDNKNYEYIWNRKQLFEVKNDTDYLLGLFDNDMCKYNVDRDRTMDPSLEEMTEVAIKKLSKNPKGYFLFVEGGLIDQAHHKNRAGKALDETVEFSKAIQKAIDITNVKDTLIVVTSDHSHTMSINGYPLRSENILGLSQAYPGDDHNFTTLSYANGPSYKEKYNFDNVTFDMEYQYPSLNKLKSETHGGDDVIIFAKGPYAHLFTGVMEQNAIPHIMAYASCVGDKSTSCKDGASLPYSNNSKINLNNFNLNIFIIIYLIFVQFM